MEKSKVYSFARALLLVLFTTSSICAQEYVLIGWNDLGMHCSNQDFSKIAVLPPFNNVTAQLILKQPGSAPRIVTGGYMVEYSIPNNTYSVGKTNFWTYAQQLFGLASPLPPNIGLTGKGLTGTLDSSGSYFTARGIPVTPFADSDLVHETPFQLVHLEAKDKSSGDLLATTDAVIPVSNEVGCVQSGCHSSPQSILNDHEAVPGFNKSGPVLCASCHASNALGTTGIPEAGIFSERIHHAHSGVAGPSDSLSTCYKCHPGPNTQCLRDIMGKNPVSPIACRRCHGTLDSIAASINSGRRPWLDEPRCGNCHGAAYAEEPGKLFRQSKGHGGLFCSACHGSPHAILPTVQPNDNIQNIRLQGFAGTLRKCSVCHTTPPTAAGPHGLIDTTTMVLQSPFLSSPWNATAGISRMPRLQWRPVAGAQRYRIQVSTDSSFNINAVDDSAVTDTFRTSDLLDSATTYYWRVRALNQTVGPWSDIWSFSTGSGQTYSISLHQYWNIISLPATTSNRHARTQFPSAMSPAYSYDNRLGYLTQDSLRDGRGYWMKFRTSQTLNLTGTPITSDTVEVSEGWNLIGSISNPVGTNSIASVGTACISPYFGYPGRYQRSDTIFPGNGYWIKVSASGKLVLGGIGSLADLTSKVQQDDPMKNLNTLTIEDAAGNAQNLYFREEPVLILPTGQFDLPPIPPPGGFDARFSSGTTAAFGNREKPVLCPIRLSTPYFPVKISWNITDQSKCDAALMLSASDSCRLNGQGSAVVSDPLAAIAILIQPAPKVSKPVTLTLQQNYPNPFNPTTIIKYRLPADGKVKLAVYNLVGEVIATLVDGTITAGEYSVEWNSENYPSGVYFYRLESVSIGDRSKSLIQIRKMVLLR